MAKRTRQLEFERTKWAHRYAHGGTLRNQRAGRRGRVISTRDPIHLVLKADRACVPGGFRAPRRFRLIYQLCDRYAARFFIKVEKMSVQGDHLHLILRTTRRSLLQNFLRVFAGQIAQRLELAGLLKREFVAVATMLTADVTDTPAGGAGGGGEGRRRLWMHRPFTRVVKGLKAFRTAMNYVQLNEQEARGVIRYRKERLRGLRDDEWHLLWGLGWS